MSLAFPVLVWTLPATVVSAFDLVIEFLASAGVIAVLFYDVPCHILMWLCKGVTAFFACEACCLGGAIFGALVLGFSGVAIVIESRNLK